VAFYAMKHTRFISDPSEHDIGALLSAPQVKGRLGDLVGRDPRVQLLGIGTYRVTGPGGEYIVRSPKDEAHLALLKKEENVQSGFREHIALQIPDTRVIDDLDGCPAFAVHRMIPGEPLTTELYDQSSSEARARLVSDLAVFFYQAHSIPLAVACAWLGLPYEGEETAARLASTRGKPLWFDPSSVVDMRPQLMRRLDDASAAVFEETVTRFGELEVAPDYMVFGHGDMHGFNIAMDRDPVGPKLVGAFDLGCAGILDAHEDFFRLSLVSEDLLERVIAAYGNLTGQAPELDRERIAVYYRAFLFYLMAEAAGESLAHLKRLLQAHLERSRDA
jgi:aminoglycoside phosphotransferase (APT) family kinase protein